MNTEKDIYELGDEYTPAKIGDIQKDKDGSEWVIIGINHSGMSRVQRNSMAHRIHAEVSLEIAKSLRRDL